MAKSKADVQKGVRDKKAANGLKELRLHVPKDQHNYLKEQFKALRDIQANQKFTHCLKVTDPEGKVISCKFIIDTHLKHEVSKANKYSNGYKLEVLKFDELLGKGK